MYLPKTVRRRTNAVSTATTAKIHSRFGTPRIEPLAMSLNAAGNGWIVLALVNTSTTPRAIPSMPSVTMNGGRLAYETSAPFTRPAATASTMPPRIATGMGTPWMSNSAVAHPDRPSTDPTDRSMPAVRITSSWPTAMMPKMATWRARLARLLPVRNWSETRVSAPNSTSNTMMPPASRPNTSPNVSTRSSGMGFASGASATAVSVCMRISRDSGVVDACQAQDVFLGCLVGRQFSGDQPFAHYQHPVGEPEHLGEVRRDHDD